MLDLLEAIELKQSIGFLWQTANERIKEEVKISLGFNEICSLKLEVLIAQQCSFIYTEYLSSF